jgi:ankyrin repeat protein
MAPLHLAARHGHTAVVRSLLARGAEPDAPSKERHTALHECAAAAGLGAAEQLGV